MFYKKSAVNEALTCSVCLQILDDPRTLPCGASTCNKCILAQVQSNNESVYDCNICQEKHKPLTENGFPPSLNLAKLINQVVHDYF
jgi:hypothetical protein